MKQLVFILLCIPVLVFSQNSKALDSLDAVIKTAENSKNWQLLADTYFAKGRTYFFEREHASALPYFLKVDSISKKYHLKNETLVLSILDRAEISRVAFTHDGIENAGELMYEALDLAKEIGSEELVHLTYKYLADLEGLKGNMTEAKKYLDLAFDYYLKKDDVIKVGQLYAVYIVYYNATDQLDKSEQANKNRIAYLRVKSDTLLLANALVAYGNFERRKRNDCNQALKHYEEAKALYDQFFKDQPNDEYRKLLQGMAACFALVNDHRKAYEYSELAYAIRDQLTKKKNQELSVKLEATYQTKQKEQEIALLQSQKELAEQQKSNQRNLMLAGLALTTLAGIFFFFQLRNRQKTNKKLRELDAAKSHFFANISHEFRTPLTLIQSPIDEELERKDLSEAYRNKFTLIKRNSNRLLSLVDQLLLLSKIEAKALKLQVQNTDIHELIAAISSSFEYAFKQKKINYRTEILVPQNGYLDMDFVEKILSNLLSNASKYTPQQGKVNLDSYIEKGYLHLKVSNSGSGLGKEQLANIFNKYYQTDTTNEGYGIGLTLVKELAEAHKGTVSASSDADMVAFEVRLPISKTAYTEEEIRSVAKTIPVLESPNIVSTYFYEEEEAESTSSEKPILLIVEDHLDMRNFIKSLFAEDFNILEAENGHLGIEAALEHIPDLIISDVMMPKIDGITLVKTLKNDEKTSHIPIILLTAKVEEEDQIKGILTGADDYITKPFSPKLIHAKIETIFSNREKARAHYNHEVVLKPAIFSANSSEVRFFKKLQEIIDSKLQETDFNVDAFSHEIGMSRMQLHRKLKATLGISASEFLRTERLKAARNLLQTSDLTISEVAYSVGFNDSNYFSKSFIKLFKISPSEFKDQSNI
ncbi:MAG: response regulator [Flavobacteriaceae bacterium]